MNRVRCAVVGTGYFGAELARIIQGQEGSTVVAVHDPEHGKTIAAELGCDSEPTLSSLCSRPDVDAVIVATPNYLHKEPVLEAAKNGKHVFCEKPIALSYQDCDEMVEACKEHNVVFMAGHVMNFFNGVRTAKRLIDEGVIGKVIYCHSARNGWEDTQQHVSWKKMKAKSGGHLYHHIHELDCIQSILGPAKAVTMIGGNLAHSGAAFGDEEDLLLLSLEFDDGAYAICEYGSAFRWPEHYILIQGTLGAIKMDLINTNMTVKHADGREERFLVHESQEEDDDRTRINQNRGKDGAIMYGGPGDKTPMWLYSIMKRELRVFVDTLQGAPVPPQYTNLLNGEAARAAIATADAATRSLKENRKVSVDEIRKRL